MPDNGEISLNIFASSQETYIRLKNADDFAKLDNKLVRPEI